MLRTEPQDQRQDRFARSSELKRDTGRPAEVSPAQFEAALAALDAQARRDGSSLSPDQPLLGPDSMTWRVYSQSVALLGAARALLLQFAHPAVEGFAQHSSFKDNPGERFHATLEIVYAMVFGPRAQSIALARRVFARHRRVAGRYTTGRGPYQAGQRYAAHQVELLVWVAATVTDTNVLTYETLVGELSEAQKDQLIAEASQLYALFGVPEGAFPQTWREFRAYFDGVIDSGVLAVNDDARELAAQLMGVYSPEGPLGEAGVRMFEELTAQWLPAQLRRDYGFEDGLRARLLRASLTQALRSVVACLPRHLRLCPARLHADRRLRGQRGPEPKAARIEQLLAMALGVDAPRRRAQLAWAGWRRVAA